jgi:hypothetical protein
MREKSSTLRAGSSCVGGEDLLHGDDALPLAGALVDRLEHLRREHGLGGRRPRHQALERAQRRLVRRIHLQHGTVALDRARQVLEVLAPQLGDAEPERDDLGRRRRELGLALEDGEQVVPALRLEVEPVERLGGVVVVRIEIHDRRVGLDGPLGIAELAVVDLAEHEEHLLLLGRDRRELGLLRVDVLEIAPAREADVEALELVELTRDPGRRR